MNSNVFKVDEYLKRIQLNSLPAATRKGLSELVRAQSFSLAFENLDVLAGSPIRLDPESIVTKLLRRGRGGYCYELNGLLGYALEAAGFEFNIRLARVTYRRTEPGPLSHLIILVKCDGEEWLVDAGFGGPGLVEPVLFKTDGEFMQNGACFRLIIEDNGDVHLQRKVAGQWAGLYIISSLPILPVDVEVTNHFVSTWERSPFRSMFMCAVPIRHGLIVIQGTEVVQLDEQLAPVKRQPLKNCSDLQQTMQSIFGINVEDRISETAWNTVVQSTAVQVSSNRN